MNKFVLASYLLFLISAVPPGVFSQNVAINGSGAVPDASAMLDISSSNKGLLIPRVTLQSTTDITTIPSPANSLIVYNTNPSMTGGTVGYWFYDASIPRWIQLNSGWVLSGNTLTGTLPSSPDQWIGTSNAADWIIKTNNAERMRVLSDGKVGVKTPNPASTLDVNGSVAFREGESLVLSNGANNDVVIDTNSFIRVTGPTAAFSISGFAGGSNGRLITLYNTTSQPMTIINNATSANGNQILTLTGENIVSPAKSSVLQLQYNSTLSRWIVIGGQNYVSSTAGYSANWWYPDLTKLSDAIPVVAGDDGNPPPSVTALSYTVSSGKNLYITNYYGQLATSLSIDGKKIVDGRSNTYTGSPNVVLRQPILVGAGKVVTGSSVGVRIYGFELPSMVTPVILNNLSTTPYIVPAGKTFVLLNSYSNVGLTVNSDLATPYDATREWNLMGTTINDATLGNSPLVFALPIMLSAGTRLKASDNNTVINGYEF